MIAVLRKNVMVACLHRLRRPVALHLKYEPD